MKATVSIITPTFNQVTFIEECIKSVISQTYKNWEQIIIDDCSTDGTSEIVSRYSKIEPRIKVIRHNKNVGISNLIKGYSEALSVAEGELIAILEGDDYWPRDKLEKQIPLFEDVNVVLTWGKGVVVSKIGKRLYEIYPKKFIKYQNIYENRPVGEAVRTLLKHNFIMPTVTVMIRKKSLLKIGGFKHIQGAPFVDYLTWLYLSLEGEFRFTREVLGFWRRHEIQTTTMRLSSMRYYHAKAIVYFYEAISSEQRKAYSISRSEVFTRSLWFEMKANLVSADIKKSVRDLFRIMKRGDIEFKLKACIVLFLYIPIFFIFRWLQKMIVGESL